MSCRIVVIQIRRRVLFVTRAGSTEFMKQWDACPGGSGRLPPKDCGRLCCTTTSVASCHNFDCVDDGR